MSAVINIVISTAPSAAVRPPPAAAVPLAAAAALRSLTCCACFYFCSDLALCRVCFYSISVYDLSLTIRVSRRLTTVDKRRFKVRLFSVSWLDSPAWVFAGLPALARRSYTPGRQPGAQTHTPLPGAPKRVLPRAAPTGPA